MYQDSALVYLPSPSTELLHQSNLKILFRPEKREEGVGEGIKILLG